MTQDPDQGWTISDDLRAALLDYFDQRADVDDGQPNDAMELLRDLEAAKPADGICRKVDGCQRAYLHKGECWGWGESVKAPERREGE